MNVQAILAENSSGELLQVFLAADCPADTMEIRIRLGLPLTIHAGRVYFIGKDGRRTSPEKAYKPTAEDIAGMLSKISAHSLYAFENELKSGFITIAGGHRVGICGRATIESGKIKTLKNISGLNFRIAHAKHGTSDDIIEFVTKPNLQNCLIISPPGCGKTTLLRDIVRSISYKLRRVSLIDERSEIANGHDIGPFTDVLDACPKAEGMLFMLRSMSPELIAVDEIGSMADIEAIEYIARCGVRLIATIHGDGLDDIRHSPNFSGLLKNKTFGRYIFLEKIGQVKQVLDREMQVIL